MPSYLVIRKVQSMLALKIFNSLPPSLTVLKNDTAKFQAAFRKFLHIHSFYSGDKFFICKASDL